MDDELSAVVAPGIPACFAAPTCSQATEQQPKTSSQDTLARFCLAQRRHPADFPDAYLQRTMLNLPIRRWRRRRILVMLPRPSQGPDPTRPRCRWRCQPRSAGRTP